MANTATKVSASPNYLTYLLTGDGTVAGPTIANATILADMEDGPLKDAWKLAYANQAAMRVALLGGGADCRMAIQLVATGVDVTAQVNQPVADVDVDAVSATKAEINIGMSDTTGQLAYLHISHAHSIVQ
jgi:hypothetical protein